MYGLTFEDALVLVSDIEYRLEDLREMVTDPEVDEDGREGAGEMIRYRLDLLARMHAMINDPGKYN